MHLITRVESEEQVDYSGTSGSVGRLGSFVEEFNADYLTPISSSAKVSTPPTDELVRDDRTQSLAAKSHDAPNLPEFSLPSPTPVVYSEDKFRLLLAYHQPLGLL